MRFFKNFDEFGKVLTKYASSQLLSNSLSLLSGFLVLKIMEPELYGLFSGYGVYLGYILLLHGGVLNGLNRELPFQLGKGNNEYSRELASTAFLLVTVISVLVFLIFITISIYQWNTEEYNDAIVIFSYSIISLLHLSNNLFLPFLYRTNKDFGRLSSIQIKVGLINLLTVLVVWQFKLYGLCARGTIISISTFYLLFSNKPFNIFLFYSPKNVLSLLKIGFPIFLTGRVNSLWQTLINNYIFLSGGALYYGYYAIAVVIQNTLSIIPVSVSQVIYPRMSIMYGEGQKVKNILKQNVKPLFTQFFLLLAFSIVGYFLLPFFIELLLPEYIQGISAAQWTIFIPVVMSLGALNNIYNVVGKQKYYLFSLVSGAVIGSLYVVIIITINGFSLETFPQGMLIGKFCQQLLGLSLLRKVIN